MSKAMTWGSRAGLSAATVLVLSCGEPVAPGGGTGVPQFQQVTAHLLAATFDAGTDGFTYADDPFRATAAPAYASGAHRTTGGFSGGGLRVLLGGIDDGGVLGMSGGWRTSFTLDAPGDATLTLQYNLTQSMNYESDEFSDALVSVDGVLRGVNGTDRLARLTGDGNGGSDKTTGWQSVTLTMPGLAAGTHVVMIGAYNNKKTAADETTGILIDNVAITAMTTVPPPDSTIVPPPDSTIVPPPDSTIVPPPDSTIVPPPDSTIVPSVPLPPLNTILAPKKRVGL